ncbi:MAG: beta-ketoacyl-ACP synthase II [Acidobacteria bacterium]|nr:beta-ketoacyl-ACP synthase II [Acidobacteriota bacterium]MBU4307958.1 beta-ketoacyl-ACP synthase II [Acidobacteriota bacterium]
MRRVVVTGIGLITPTGKSKDENWDNIRNGRGGIGKITRFDASRHASQIAGEVKNYDPNQYFDRKDLRKFDPFIQFALIASEEAVKDSGLDLNAIDKEKAGIYIGSGIGGIHTIEINKEILMQKGPDRISPFFLPACIANLAAGQVSIKFGFKGPNLANCTACATGTHAIGDSTRIIQRGEADIMIAGGAEYPITPLGVAGFTAMRALSTRNDQPEKASRPFDKNRDGFVIAEGSAVLVLESLEHAHNRGARIYAEVVGYGYTGDAYHMTAPDPEADGAFRAMKMAVADAQLKPEDIVYINAHGTSTELNDKLETHAIKRLFSDHAAKLAISSTKSMTGHMLGATGSAEAAFTALAIANSFIPPTINYETRDEECDLNYTPNQGLSREIPYALSNSFGFGGTNASLLLKKFSE